MLHVDALERSKARFAHQLFDQLFERYRQAVPYVRRYQELLRECGGDGTFLYDHVAFRTIARERPMQGINSMAPLFLALGYTVGGSLEFPDDHLFAQWFDPPQLPGGQHLPKIFISELQVWKLDWTAQAIIRETMDSPSPQVDGIDIAKIISAIQDGKVMDELLDKLLQWFNQLPWNFPLKCSMDILGDDTPYGVWVLHFGWMPNHFACLIDDNHPLGDIEQHVPLLLQAGVPMKSVIEGERGSRLRQTATQAVSLAVPVFDGEQLDVSIEPYAYLEFTQRGLERDAATGELRRFEGFEVLNAAQLLRMTDRAAQPAAASQVTQATDQPPVS